MTKKKGFPILLLTLAYLSIAIFTLGYQHTPINGWRVLGYDVVYLELYSPTTIDSLYLLTHDHTPLSLEVYVYKDGSWEFCKKFKDGYYYSWRQVDLKLKAVDRLKLVFYGSGGRIDEAVLIDASGNKLPVKNIYSEAEGVDRLFDEQELVRFPFTHLSETYFDEIYYVRTAENYLNMEEPYEWTHPPLGKLILSLSILLLGFNPFGWRFMGVLFSALMLPLLYFFSQRMFKSQVAALTSTILIFFDFLHFTMGRMGTVDTFAVFFIILGHVFFFLNYDKLLTTGKLDAARILLGSVFFFLAFSVKWYAIYGYIGNIILLLVLLIKGAVTSEEPLKVRLWSMFLKPVTILVAALILGGLVYLSTFIPYMTLGHNINDVINRQWSMYSYHANLKAEHPFSSSWWSWPLIIRPLWLHVSDLADGIVSTIVAMGNPVIWWFGIAAVFVLLVDTLKNRDKVAVFLLVAFFSQWIPYMLITRCLFIYHFYMNVPILILILTYFLKDLPKLKFGVWILIGFLIAAGLLFALFYPVISGYPVSISYRDALRWFNSWIF